MYKMKWKHIYIVILLCSPLGGVMLILPEFLDTCHLLIGHLSQNDLPDSSRQVWLRRGREAEQLRLLRTEIDSLSSRLIAAGCVSRLVSIIQSLAAGNSIIIRVLSPQPVREDSLFTTMDLHLEFYSDFRSLIFFIDGIERHLVPFYLTSLHVERDALAGRSLAIRMNLRTYMRK